MVFDLFAKMAHAVDMPRILRVVVPGMPHHITQRGVRSQRVFFKDRDRQVYLDLLAQQSRVYGVQHLVWCLMDNHIHLVAVPTEEDSFSKAFGETHRQYALWINSRQAVTGHLFQERFYSSVMDDEHLLNAACYIEDNPVRAKRVKHASEYKWSSARYHLGLTSSDPLVTDPTLAGLVDDWASFLAQAPGNYDDIRKETRTGRPCGSESFISMLEQLTGRILARRKPGPKSKRQC